MVIMKDPEHYFDFRFTSVKFVELYKQSTAGAWAEELTTASHLLWRTRRGLNCQLENANAWWKTKKLPLMTGFLRLITFMILALIGWILGPETFWEIVEEAIHLRGMKNNFHIMLNLQVLMAQLKNSHMRLMVPAQ